jgi:L-arabinose isomerase
LNSHGDNGLHDSEIGIMSALALSLLSDDGISLAEVGDLQTGVALFLARQLGARAMYAELDFVDRENDRWFIANSGEMDVGMIDSGRPVWLRSNVNFQGVCGGGAAFDAAVRPGPATLFSFTEGPKQTYRLIIAEGEVLSERSDLLQLVNCTFRPQGVTALEAFRDWCAAGAVHHAALSPGHIGNSLQGISDVLGIECRAIS